MNRLIFAVFALPSLGANPFASWPQNSKPVVPKFHQCQVVGTPVIDKLLAKTYLDDVDTDTVLDRNCTSCETISLRARGFRVDNKDSRCVISW
jgi:hypothetical protein